MKEPKRQSAELIRRALNLLVRAEVDHRAHPKSAEHDVGVAV